MRKIVVIGLCVALTAAAAVAGFLARGDTGHATAQAAWVRDFPFGTFPSWIVKPPHGVAVKLIVTGSASQTDGNRQNITVTAVDAYGDVVRRGPGDQSFTFSGASQARDR